MNSAKKDLKEYKMEKITEYANPLSRVLISLIFIMFGLNKIFNYSATSAWMEDWPRDMRPGCAKQAVIWRARLAVRRDSTRDVL